MVHIVCIVERCPSTIRLRCLPCGDLKLRKCAATDEVVPVTMKGTVFSNFLMFEHFWELNSTTF